MKVIKECVSLLGDIKEEGLEMISEEEINQIIEIDKIVIEPILADFFANFDEKKRRISIKAEIESGSQFILAKKDNKVKAYLQYNLSQSICNVEYIQMVPEIDDNVITKILFKEIFNKFLNDEKIIIKSTVPISNKNSIRIHNKLGFEKKEMVEDKLNFQIEMDNLKRLLLFIKD